MSKDLVEQGPVQIIMELEMCLHNANEINNCESRCNIPSFMVLATTVDFGACIGERTPGKVTLITKLALIRPTDTRSDSCKCMYNKEGNRLAKHCDVTLDLAVRLYGST